MLNCNCRCKCNCPVIAVIVSIILGIVAAFLQIAGMITVTPAFLWVVLGIAVVYLGVLVLATAFAHSEGSYACLCRILTTLLIGILGAILFAIVLLGVGIVACCVISAILVGLLIFFFFLTVTATACFVRFLANCGS